MFNYADFFDINVSNIQYLQHFKSNIPNNSVFASPNFFLAKCGYSCCLEPTKTECSDHLSLFQKAERRYYGITYFISVHTKTGAGMNIQIHLLFLYIIDPCFFAGINPFILF